MEGGGGDLADVRSATTFDADETTPPRLVVVTASRPGWQSALTPHVHSHPDGVFHTHDTRQMGLDRHLLRLRRPRTGGSEGRSQKSSEQGREKVRKVSK